VPQVAENEQGFTGRGKTQFRPVLYQGTTLVVPRVAVNEQGFTGRGKTQFRPVLYQGTTLVVPIKPME
jgi:hypothetical protein